MSDYGDEIIIKKVASDNDKAPVMRAEITMNGNKYKAGLWVWTRKDGSPVLDKAGAKQLKGKIELDDYEPQSESKSSSARRAEAEVGRFADSNDFPY